MSRHEVHSISSHTLHTAGQQQTDKTECFTRQWSRRNHGVTDALQLR